MALKELIPLGKLLYWAGEQNDGKIERVKDDAF